MAGICSYGAYIPLWRLSRAEIANAWGGRATPGEKAVASFDEDSVTMAVAAARDCLKGIDRSKVDAVYFASTTFPYKEKQSSSIIAGALALRHDIRTADFSGSRRGGTIALRAALDSVDSGATECILVVAADVRLGYPNGELEMTLGDGAAALLVGNSGIAVNVEGCHTIYDEYYDLWRLDEDTFIRSWEDRFMRETGYTRVVPEAVTGALKRFSLTLADFAKVAIPAPTAREYAQAARRMKLQDTQVQDILHAVLGDTGTPHSLMMLVAALEEAKAGDRILLGGYGDGCDLFNLKVTEEIEKVGDRRGVKHHLQAKKMLPFYQKYVAWRGLMPTQPQARPDTLRLSVPAVYRDREWGLSLLGCKCQKCGHVLYPRQRVCSYCQAEDQMEPYPLAERKATLNTFSHDMLAAAVDLPTTICVVDFEGGGRTVLDMTDREVTDVETGMALEMTFRRIHQVRGMNNYWWKCAPIRC